MAATKEVVEAYKNLQNQAVEVALELVQNAKKRRAEIQRIWALFQQERKRSFQERMLEQIGEKNEKVYSRYQQAKGILSRGNQLKFADPTIVEKIQDEEAAIRRELKAMQRDENAEGQAIKKEVELAEQETAELEKVEKLLASRKGKLLREDDFLEIEKELEQASVALGREIQDQQFQTQVDAQENKIAAMMGNIEGYMRQMESKEATAAK